MAEETYILKIMGLSKNFGGLMALDRVDLQLLSGKITSVIGPNGAGKTTLFNIISGIIRATRGSILFNGQEILKMKGHEIARLGIARTFQNLRLFNNMNVLENVMVSYFYRKAFNVCLGMTPFWVEGDIRKRAKEESEALLKLTGLYDHRFYRPMDLPYGSQRRLEIARGIALDPKVILIDEPCCGMTQTEASDLMQLILSLKTKGITVLLIEHNMNVVMDISDWIVVLNFGKKISEGTANYVRNDLLVKEAYLGK